jgi:glycosyltransferase involved in cell wall biosynthesis
MIHGDLSEGQLKSLYTHPTIKGYVTATHGEGFGLPIFEAAINELPVIAADWSAYMDFMTLDGKPAFLTVKYQIGPVGDESVWEGVIEKGTSWCYPILNSLKARMRELLDTDYTRFKSRAKKLSAKILETHKQEDLFVKFNKTFSQGQEVEDWLNSINKVEEYT